MSASAIAPTARLGRRTPATLAAFAAACLLSHAALAQEPPLDAPPGPPGPPSTLLMHIDGVKVDAKTPIGTDFFPLMNFSFSTDPDTDKSDAQVPPGQRFGQVRFTMAISPPAVPLWQLAARRADVPKVTLAVLDPASGKTRYRVDFEGVTVQSVSMQTLGRRDAAVGEFSYQRIRLRYGDGENALTASWDKTKNAPWK
jgi:type VI secretion system (T6SS) effector Hcp